jgi:hypothetical protein
MSERPQTSAKDPSLTIKRRGAMKRSAVYFVPRLPWLAAAWNAPSNISDGIWHVLRSNPGMKFSEDGRWQLVSR